MTDPRFPVPPGAGGRHRAAPEATTPATPADPAPATTVAPAATPSPPEPPSADPAPAPASAAEPDTGTPPKKKKKIQPQPVLTASSVQTLLAAAVTVGWVQLDDATVATLATVIAAMVAGLVTWLARGKVTPTSSPRDSSGRPLT